ncbi:hypothetical protein, partial [Daejeonella sp.]|uniref:hypothetical protein n=1 Tax=Daejeonella sp. TaxID=2805397 RepID=UPI0037C1A0F6
MSVISCQASDISYPVAEVLEARYFLLKSDKAKTKWTMGNRKGSPRQGCPRQACAYSSFTTAFFFCLNAFRKLSSNAFLEY